MSDQFNTSEELCKYQFTEKEKQDLAMQIAESLNKLREVKTLKKAATSEFTSRIDALSAEINSLATKVKDGYELRSMLCKIIKDYDDKKVIYRRKDNNEIIKTREMAESELQLNLDDQKNDSVS